MSLKNRNNYCGEILNELGSFSIIFENEPIKFIV